MNFFFITEDKKPVSKRKPFDEAHKNLLWKTANTKRAPWERKYSLYFRNILNREFKRLAERVDSTNYLDKDLPSKVMKRESIEKAFIQMYTEVGKAFGKDISQRKTEFDWNEWMTSYAKTRAGKKITSIHEDNIEWALKAIRGVLELSIDEGLGSDETARLIRKGLLDTGADINQWRALRIARTEVMTASNQGAYVGARNTGYPMEKYWIATRDSRTRDTHAVMEEQNPKDMDEAFIVGGVPAECPGDPDLFPEDVINCRCSIAFKVKDI